MTFIREHGRNACHDGKGGLQGRFVGMHGFGDSGKIVEVYKKFDITTEAVVRAARDSLQAVYG